VGIIKLLCPVEEIVEFVDNTLHQITNTNLGIEMIGLLMLVGLVYIIIKANNKLNVRQSKLDQKSKENEEWAADRRQWIVDECARNGDYMDLIDASIPEPEYGNTYIIYNYNSLI
jgi:hypothetical protein